MKPLTSAQHDNILSLLDSGHNDRQTASITGIHHSTISRIHKKYHPHIQKSSGGCPSKLIKANIRYATHLITSQRAENAVQVTKALMDITNQSLSPHTTHRHLKKAGMKAVKKVKKPLLSQRHRRERLDFALAHQHWTIEDWKTVIWSDETKINRLGSDGVHWGWKKPGEGLSDRLVTGTLKFGGGSMMMWGCMLWEGVGYASKIDEKMDGELYIKILQDELQETIAFYGKDPSTIIFQQDNDPKHTCRMAQTYFQDQEYTVMKWPAQSPDLNPIEHLWNHLKRKLGEYERPPGGILELYVKLQWASVFDLNNCCTRHVVTCDCE